MVRYGCHLVRYGVPSAAARRQQMACRGSTNYVVCPPWRISEYNIQKESAAVLPYPPLSLPTPWKQPYLSGRAVLGPRVDPASAPQTPELGPKPSPSCLKTTTPLKSSCRRSMTLAGGVPTKAPAQTRMRSPLPLPPTVKKGCKRARSPLPLPPKHRSPKSMKPLEVPVVLMTNKHPWAKVEIVEGYAVDPAIGFIPIW